MCAVNTGSLLCRTTRSATEPRRDEPAESGAAVGPHHDQVDPVVGRGVEDLLVRATASEVALDLDTAVRGRLNRVERARAPLFLPVDDKVPLVSARDPLVDDEQRVDPCARQSVQRGRRPARPRRHFQRCRPWDRGSRRTCRRYHAPVEVNGWQGLAGAGRLPFQNWYRWTRSVPQLGHSRRYSTVACRHRFPTTLLVDEPALAGRGADR